MHEVVPLSDKRNTEESRVRVAVGWLPYQQGQEGKQATSDTAG